ncbi:uncharacterized protein LOC129005644 [Macrosteles quadrilineatus]|uniref:uncharacterized protein LOC129005644 n=1 Tax=Macrosteles quadrilineatus TaxID=74068 RepID=UPI0023E1F79A|nr:uncharacterized protein LOC129005644 [Macrosteles quadrilineatus]
MQLFVASSVLISIALLAPRVEGGCSLSCAEDQKPVCGHSRKYGYKSFEDKCDLEQANHCKGGDWCLIHQGKCSHTEIGGCPQYCEEVCGYSPSQGYKSFINKCYLDIESSYSDYKFAHKGACTPKELSSARCPWVCPKLFAPVCVYSPNSGYRTFPNKCLYEAENRCHYGSYSLKHTGACTEKEIDSNCNWFCTEEYRPVCGFSEEKGYKTFGNLCIFYKENSCPKFDSNYKLVHSGECKKEEKESFCKPGFCPETGEPVCAVSLPYYRTFRNKCLFYVENSCKYGDFKIVHKGECSVTETEKSCKEKCYHSEEPVCGYSYARGYKTFTNRCYLNYENSCYGSDYAAVHRGECKKEELELYCNSFCKGYKGKKVCGVSPTKGYTTFDNECYLYSENTCKYGDYKFAHFGECTKKENGLICLPDFCLKPGTKVCGYSKSKGFFTFPNRCQLNKENICNGRDYIVKHEGECSASEIGGKCPVLCTLQYSPVCGYSSTFSYKTFSNTCILGVENNCKGGDYKLNHQGECTKKELEKNCQLQCTYDYRPICAKSPTKGYKTFSNKCHFIYDVSCYGSDYKYEYGGVCKKHEVLPVPPKWDQGDCKKGAICTKEYKPVCGYIKSDRMFKTFSNKCLFNAEKCKYNEDLIFAHEGECSKGELENDCKRKISEEISPVCGRSPTLGYKTFKNIYLLLLSLSCYRSDYYFAYEGKCQPSHLPPICTELCVKKYDPYCGYSPSTKEFSTFDNKCWYDKEVQCAYGDHILAHKGACTKPEIENDCYRVCSSIYDPVCAYSSSRGYKTYENVCSFIRDLTCKGCDYVFVHKGKCRYPEGPQEGCPLACSQEENPVCAFSSSTKSYKTFLNQDRLKAENKCYYGDYVFVHKGKCTKEEIGRKCYRKCPYDYKPVCGVNVKEGYRTFPCLCELEVANKCDGADYSLAHVGKCTHKELGGACRHNCPLHYTGLCGYSKIKGHKTFANECFMDRENHCTHSDYRVIHKRKCTPVETGHKCNRFCKPIYSPICTKSPEKKYKTYANFCLMDKDNSCYYKDYNVIHQGECFPWELCVNCRKP